MQEGNSVRRQNNLPPNPIIDSVYYLAKSLNQAAISRDKERLQVIWDAFSVHYWLAQEAGANLPLPSESDMPSSDLEYLVNDRIHFEQFESIAMAVIRHIELKWTKRSLDRS